MKNTTQHTNDFDAYDEDNCRWDFFHRVESNRVDVKTLTAKTYSFTLPADMNVNDAVEYARTHSSEFNPRMPKGSNRCGCQEVQNDTGIFSRQNNSRADWNFTSWND